MRVLARHKLPGDAQAWLFRAALQDFKSISSPEMSKTGLKRASDEPLSRCNVTVTVGCDGGYLPDPAAFAAAADQAAWSRSASIIRARLADKIISVGTVTTLDWYAAMAVARAVVSDALKRQALSSTQSADGHAHHRAEPAV